MCDYAYIYHISMTIYFTVSSNGQQPTREKSARDQLNSPPKTLELQSTAETPVDSLTHVFTTEKH